MSNPGSGVSSNQLQQAVGMDGAMPPLREMNRKCNQMDATHHVSLAFMACECSVDHFIYEERCSLSVSRPPLKMPGFSWSSLWTRTFF